MLFHRYIKWGQSNTYGMLPVSNAPVGMFTGSILNGVKVFNGTTITDYDVNVNGASGNGASYVGVGGSSSGNYSWIDIVLHWAATVLGQNVLVVQVAEGGSTMELRTLTNGSHNTDVATLAGTYPTTPILHTALVDRFNSCSTYLTTNSHTVIEAGCFADQGEADAGLLKNRVAQWTSKFSAIRTLTGNANLPFYYCTRPSYGNFYVPYMDEADFELAALSQYNHCIKNFNGTTFDGAHFDALTMLSLANRCKAIINEYNPGVTTDLAIPSITGTEYNELAKAIEYIGITDSNEAEAAEYYITEMQTANLWTNRVASFLMMGNNYALNLKNPNFRTLTLSGATSVSGGINFDGVNDSLNTSFRLQDFSLMRSSSFSISLYLKENSLSVGDQALASWNEISSGAQGVLGRFYAPFSSKLRMDIGSATFNLSGDTLIDNAGLFTFGVSSGNARIHKNGRLFGVKVYTANEFINSILQIGVDVPGGSIRWLDNVMPYLSYGFSMTDAQKETHYNIVLATLTIMSRQASDNMPLPVFQNIIDYANTNSITKPSDPILALQETLFNARVSIMRREVNFYEFVNGGSAEDFININWVNPATHLMTWPASKTYGTTGISLNGTTQYGDPNFNASTQGIERYLLNRASRKYWIGTVGGTVCDGTITTGSRNNISLSSTTAQRINSGSTQLNSAADMSGTGLKIISRNDETNVVLYNAGVKLSRTAGPVSVVLNEKQTLGKSGATFGSSVYRSASLGGDSITDAEEATLRTVEQTYYTAMGL